MSQITAISQEDINIIGSSLSNLSYKMGTVSNDISSINKTVSTFNKDLESVKKDVKSLEEEIRDFLFEIKGSSLVSNAQNEILLNQNEINKLYGFQDQIKIAFDDFVNFIEKDGIKYNIFTCYEKYKIPSQNYYLSYIFSSIYNWILKKDEEAQKNLNIALKLDNAKTSLFFCLFYLKLDRFKSALIWFKNYLSFQNPMQVNYNFKLLIDLISSSSFDKKMTLLLNEYIKSWKDTIKKETDIIQYNKNRWTIFFKQSTCLVNNSNYPFSSRYIENYERLYEIVGNSYSYTKAFENFKQLINSNNSNNNLNIKTSIKKLINTYEKDELELRKNILRNQLIINNKGDLKKANEEYKNSELNLNNETDIITHLTNILLVEEKTNINTKNISISFTKDIIIDSLEKTYNNENTDNKNINIKIKIDDWTEITENGQNEKELQESLINHIKGSYQNEKKRYQYFDLLTIMLIIVTLLGLFLITYNTVFGLIITIVPLIILLYKLYNNYKDLKYLESKINKTIEIKIDILNNVIAEIVDMNFAINKNNKHKKELIKYINSFNETYFKY